MDQDFIKNPIKQHIIGALMQNEYLKYHELMPEDTENDLFNYHLQHLVKKGLVDLGILTQKKQKVAYGREFWYKDYISQFISKEEFKEILL